MPHSGSYARPAPLVIAVFALLAAACETDAQDVEGGSVAQIDDTVMRDEGADDLEATLVEAISTVHLPAGAPRYLAVVVHGLAASGIAIVEPGAGRSWLVPSTAELPADPVWAPDGASLLFRDENQLELYALREGRTKNLDIQLSSFGATPYAYSGQTSLIAVAESAVVHILSADGSARRGQFPLPQDMSFADLVWSDDGQTLVVLASSNSGGPASLVWIDAASMTMNTRQAEGIVNLLGWHAAAGGPVVVSAALDRVGNGTAVLLPSGKLRPVREADENEAGEFVLAYRSATGQTVVMLRTEDLGDPVRLQVLDPDGSHPRPWLTPYPMLTDLALSAGGSWAAFVDATPLADSGEPYGDVYVTAFGEDNAVLVLRADPESYAFSSPALSP